MRKILLVLMSICMLAFVVGCGNDASKTTDIAKPSTTEKITIQAAASLKGALTELADAYKKEHNLADDQITINFAGSGTLRQQIEQGAPASLFISADEKNMKKSYLFRSTKRHLNRQNIVPQNKLMMTEKLSGLTTIL